MSDSTEKLRQELQAAQRTIAELQAKLESCETTYRLTTLELGENRSALQFMLEDLEAGSRKIEQAHQEWMASLDVVDDPIFLHDAQFRILRCNKAYQRCAGMPFQELLGQPYYEVFPKTGTPLPCCLRVMKKTEAAADEEEMAFGDTTYRSRTFSVYGEQGDYLHSVHILEDITEKQRAEAERQRLSEAIRQAAEVIAMVNAEACISYINPAFTRLFGYAPDEIIGKSTAILAAPTADTLQPDAAFRIIREQGYFQGEALRRAKDGTVLPVYINVAALHGSEGKFEGFVTAVTDLRPIKQAQQALVESEEKFRIIFEGVLDGILLADAETKRFAGGNPAIYHMLDYSSDEIMQLGVADIHPQQALPHVVEQFEKQLRGEIQLAVDTPVKRKDGSIFYADIKSSPVSFGGRNYLLGIFRDITERKRAEQKLKDLSDRLQHILASTPAVHYACQIDGEHFVPTFASINLKAIWGYDPAEYLDNAEWWWSGIHPEERDSVTEAIRAVVMAVDRSHYAHEYRFRHKDGAYRWIHDELQIIRDHAGQPLEIVGSWLDITERKQAEERLFKSEAQAQAILKSLSESVVVLDTSGAVISANDAATRLFGRTLEELVDPETDPRWKIIRSDGSLFTVEEQPAIVALRTGVPVQNVEMGVPLPDGTFRWVLVNAQLIRDISGTALGVVASSFDITARKQAEASAQHASRALATLGAVNRTLVHATDEGELLQTVCRAIVEQKGYRLAWVGYKQDDEHKSIKIMARADHDEGYLDAMQLTWAETGDGMGPSGRAICSGKTQVCQDMASDPLYRPWRDEALKRGYAADIALPLTRRSGEVFGILHVYAAEVNAFTTAEIDLLEEMAGDLAFGVRSLHIRRQRDLAMDQSQRHLEKLQNSLEDTIRAMASLVEMRDPYTAGHQVRVADLAMSIARQMGLPDEQVHGIHLAGVVHDLGKIRIPAEILSKPGKISDIERSLIKVHPQAGYDILKGIDFPWPIAQMVLQHHERFDGSGYPQGLKGDAILLEARILAVADVVEAVSSHRPYRPGLGIEVALEEITKQRGVHYDPRVVDVCLAVFREQGYSFK